MKLLLCPICQDVRKLSSTGVYCDCGASWGRYLSDGLHAEISGEAIPLGFANSTLVSAVIDRPKHGDGSRFTAFVIPHRCDTISTVSHERTNATQPQKLSVDHGEGHDT
jgi:hypothetical protein